MQFQQQCLCLIVQNLEGLSNIDKNFKIVNYSFSFRLAIKNVVYFSFNMSLFAVYFHNFYACWKSARPQLSVFYRNPLCMHGICSVCDCMCLGCGVVRGALYTLAGWDCRSEMHNLTLISRDWINSLFQLTLLFMLCFMCVAIRPVCLGRVHSSFADSLAYYLLFPTPFPLFFQLFLYPLHNILFLLTLFLYFLKRCPLKKMSHSFADAVY